MFRSCKKEEKGKKGEFTLLNEDTVEEWESEYGNITVCVCD